ncbi:MAG: dTDP-4-dehydrorhamnose 3,5-epimerase [Acidobacteria bacterium]|nr:MAG: dTDP-4-dehydrorhamnose 3,5-epimerase [Acidobacteriota bacterium]PYR75134.1 MAG: dTDP-4-dehydrorhamnose 3,5-epimerase [Acidobacteriota bacterium]
MPFQFARTSIDGVMLIEPKVFPDDRGFFMEAYKRSDFAAAGLEHSFVQENHSRSTYGTLRGLHYQRAPKAQGKLVRAIVGEIFDVAVDIRRGSPTFGAWFGVRLSAANRRLLYVPPWCAHGFCVVSPEAEVIYNTTEEYAPDCEEGLRWDDRGISIPWPVSSPILSERDRRWPLLGDSAASAVCC